MSEMQHAERAHALLSASGADRWINCPPSARLQETVPDKRSEFADEGTAAHEYSELLLRKRLTILKAAERKKLDRQIEDFKSSNAYYDAEMEDAVTSYVEFVEERFMAAKARSEDAIVSLEERLDFSHIVPDGFGTGDVVLIADGVLEVIDLKYGKGVPVSAEGNPQLRLYGLGALHGFSWMYDIKEVQMTIVQPRLDSISTDALPVDQLLDWAASVVEPSAKLAFEGKGDFKAGEHCRWCKVKGNCRARAEANMEALQYEFREPSLLSLDEIGAILAISDQLRKWAKDVEDYAHEQALAGEKVPGWKLVEGRSNRVITDKDAAMAMFEEAELQTEQYLKIDLLGITALEKQVGKKEVAELLGDLIQKPTGKPTLVPETDRRPEINSLDEDFKNIEFD